MEKCDIIMTKHVLKAFTVDGTDYVFEVKDRDITFYIIGGYDKHGMPFITHETEFFGTFSSTKSYGNRIKNPLKVFATVRNHIFAYITENCPNSFYFTTSGGTEKKFIIYERFAKEIVDKFNYKYYVNGDSFYFNKVKNA